MQLKVRRWYPFVVLLLLVTSCILIIPGCTGREAIESTSVDSNNESTTYPSNSNADTHTGNDEHTNYFGNTNGNLVNGGLAAIQGDWIYYCTSEGLFKVNVDGTEEELLFSDATDKNCIFDINVVGNWVYYENFIGGVRAQYKVTTSGTDQQQIGIGRQTHVIGDTLYWLDKPIGYKMNTDGTDIQVVYQASICSDYTLNVCEDWIYFCIQGDDGKEGIYKIRTDGTERTCLYSGRTNYLVVDHDFIYFEGYRDCNLYRMKLDGSELELVFDDTLQWSFNIADGWIYYCSQNDHCMYKVRTNGTDKQKVCSDYASDMSIVGDWIYYKAEIQTEASAYQIQCRIKNDGTERQEFGVREETYYGDSQPTPSEASSNETNAATSSEDFSSFVGTYSLYQQSPFTEYGDYYPASITLNENGTITGQNIANTAPIYVTRNDNGTIMCMISEGEQELDELVGFISIKPREFYVICPVGVTSGFDGYPDYDNLLGTDTVRIRYMILDGGVVDIMYHKN